MSENLPVRPLRVGDADRQKAVDRLAAGYEQGMLSLDEFNERTGQAWQAVHSTDLDSLLADLPATAQVRTELAVTTPSRGLVPLRPDDSTGSPLTLAVFSGAERAGEWTASGTHTAVAIMGGVEIDLREARFTAPETTILVFAFWGGIKVTVPPDVRVRVSGLPIMGGFGAEGSINPATLPPDAPLVTIRGVAIMGGVGVERLAHGA